MRVKIQKKCLSNVGENPNKCLNCEGLVLFSNNVSFERGKIISRNVSFSSRVHFYNVSVEALEMS